MRDTKKNRQHIYITDKDSNVCVRACEHSGEGERERLSALSLAASAEQRTASQHNLILHMAAQQHGCVEPLYSLPAAVQHTLGCGAHAHVPYSTRAALPSQDGSGGR